ncbi:type II toxin-antitoxin system Phd/YefM family antitoxin [Catenulispora rubra]|uniref:type II toxin-antitoxin system Phd/YefM family antitoxin n=1 Tax=Catenulispora rubra TaxID=280293 RepID=UPI002B26EBAD|nr:type II toxin-antitoxin system Phd/YefM family antitoxin [Catenulispora rubra]
MPMMTVGMTEARRQLRELAARARHGHERIAITDHGRPTAVLISPEDAEEYARLEAAEIAREIAEAKAAAAASGKPPVVIGDMTNMSFEEFDAIVTKAARDT